MRKDYGALCSKSSLRVLLCGAAPLIAPTGPEVLNAAAMKSRTATDAALERLIPLRREVSPLFTAVGFL